MIVVATILIIIPVPFGNGYIHLGDAMIFLSVLILGWKYGAVAAGFGSALADLLVGYAIWSPWTLFVKGIMAAVMGTFHRQSDVQAWQERSRHPAVSACRYDPGGFGNGRRLLHRRRCDLRKLCYQPPWEFHGTSYSSAPARCWRLFCRQPSIKHLRESFSHISQSARRKNICISRQLPCKSLILLKNQPVHPVVFFMR